MSAYRFARNSLIATAATLALTACDSSDGDADEGAVMGGGAEVESDFDASTTDVMSVDVVAGGIEPMTDPASADAGIDMLGDNTPTEIPDEAPLQQLPVEDADGNE